MLENILIGIAGSVIASNIVWLIANVVRGMKDRRSGFTGQWITEILDSTGRSIKRDRITLRQSKENVVGIIRRESPQEEIHREWKFSGRIQNRDFFAVFWSLDPSIVSYGCWYVHQQSDNKFEGYYLRLANTGTDITTIPLRIFREKINSKPNVPQAFLQVVVEGVSDIFSSRK